MKEEGGVINFFLNLHDLLFSAQKVTSLEAKLTDISKLVWIEIRRLETILDLVD